MTERTNLDVAVDAYAARFVIPPDDIAADMRAALDAIHPALAHLAPDDVRGLFDEHDCEGCRNDQACSIGEALERSRV